MTVAARRVFEPGTYRQQVRSISAWPNLTAMMFHKLIESKLHNLFFYLVTLEYPAEAVGFLGRKNPQHAFFRRGSKAVGPMS